MSGKQARRLIHDFSFEAPFITKQPSGDHQLMCDILDRSRWEGSNSRDAASLALIEVFELPIDPAQPRCGGVIRW